MQKRRRPRDTRGTPEGRQGIHPTPWQWILSHACHAKAAETKGHQRDARGTPGRTSDPLAMDIVPRLPRRTGGDQATPQRDARAYIRPLGNGHCPTPATQKRRRPRDTRGTPEGRKGVRPLGNGYCPTAATQKRRRPRDTRGTPEGRQGVHPTPWQWTLSHACHAEAAETKGHQTDARGTPGHHPTPWQWTLSHACHAKAAETKGHQTDARGTPGRTSDPLWCVCECECECVCVCQWWVMCLCVCVSVMNDVCESDVWCVCVSDEWYVCVWVSDE